MDQTIEMTGEQSQNQRVSPVLIMINNMLALSSQELQEAVYAELEANPALENREARICPTCGMEISSLVCKACSKAVSTSPDGDWKQGGDTAEGYDDYPAYSRSSNNSLSGDDEFDPLSIVASEIGTIEQLLMDLSATLCKEDYRIASYLVGNLDEHGYLRCTLRSAAIDLNVPLSLVEKALDAVQRTGPTGIGARDVCECLLLQLRELEAAGQVVVPPHTKDIISNHLTDLAERKYSAIAKQLGATSVNVAAVRDFIKQHLQPRPLQEHSRTPAQASPVDTVFAVPDVAIHLRDGKLEAEVLESYRFNLRVNPFYQQFASSTSTEAASLPDAERAHIRSYVRRSKLFISNLNQRRQTIKRITECLIELQEDFILHGARHIKPITRSQVAWHLGLHESTVSRATANKYVMLPNKQVVPFSLFFTASMSVKDAMKEIICAEKRPISDSEIMSRLQADGIRIARRTVTKYRHQLGIMSSTQR